MSYTSLVQLDRYPLLRGQIADTSGYMNITGATVNLEWWYTNRVSGLVYTGAAVIIGPTSGVVQYAWSTGNVINPGVYSYRWKATLADGKTYAYPNDGYLSFQIVDYNV